MTKLTICTTLKLEAHTSLYHCSSGQEDLLNHCIPQDKLNHDLPQLEPNYPWSFTLLVLNLIFRSQCSFIPNNFNCVISGYH